MRVGSWGLALALAAVAIGCDTPSEPTPKFCEFALAPAAFTPCMPATELTISVSTSAGCLWTAVPGASWLTLVSGAAGNGAGTIRLGVTENWDAPRAGVVPIRDAQGTRVAEASVMQAGCRYTVLPAGVSVSATGGTRTFDVLQQSDPLTCGGPLQNACRWSAVPDVTWITILSPMPRAGDDRVSFEVAPNDGVERTGQITVRDQVVTVTQMAR
jgi:hypothetical protein